LIYSIVIEAAVNFTR